MTLIATIGHYDVVIMMKHDITVTKKHKFKFNFFFLNKRSFLCVCKLSSQQLSASDRRGVLFITRTGLSPPPGACLTMIVMAMECE